MESKAGEWGAQFTGVCIENRGVEYLNPTPPLMREGRRFRCEFIRTRTFCGVYCSNEFEAATGT